MSTPLPHTLRRPLPALAPTMILAVALPAAAGLGFLVTKAPLYAAALVIGLGVILLIAARVDALPLFLVFTMFIESVALGSGFGVGRIAGALAIGVIVLFILQRGHANGLKPNALLAVAGALVFWMLLSVYWADVAGYVFGNTLSYLLSASYMFALAILVRTERQLVALGTTMVVGSVVFGVLSFLTYASQGGGQSEDVRAAGLSGDPNYFAVYEVASLPVALALAAREPRPGRRLLLYGVITVIILSVVSSLSRTGIVALTLVVLITLLLPARFLFRSALQKLAYVGALAVATAAGVAVGSTALLARIQTILDPSKTNDRGAGRTDLYAAALNGWHEHPFRGLGSGGFQANSLSLLQATPGVDVEANYVSKGRVVHNAYLETLTDLGLIGLVLFALLLLLTARAYLVAFRRARVAGAPALERFSIALLLSFCGWMVSATFLSNQTGKLLWVLIGLALALDTMTRPLAPQVTGLLGGRRRGRRAVALPAVEGAPVYDQGVPDQVSPRERRVAEEFEAIRVERRRLARLEETLQQRLQGIQEREHALPAPEPVVDSSVGRLDELERELAALRARLEQQDASAETLAKRVALVTQREQTLARRHGELAVLQGTLEQRERELEERAAVAAPPVQPPPAPEPVVAVPEPVVAAAAPVAAQPVQPPSAVTIPEPPVPAEVYAPEPAAAPPVEAPGAFNLIRLQQLVEAHGSEHPDQVDEWRYYLLYLRDYADYDGHLPSSFDYLVADVFDLLFDR